MSNETSSTDSQRYTLSTDGTYWIDTQTGLWIAAEESRRIPYDDAVTYCKAFRGGGFKDWKMPTLLEQESFRDTDRYNPALPEGFKSHGEYVWTSTQTAWTKDETGSSRSFFVVNLYYGVVSYSYAYGRFRVRPVRVGGAARPGQ